jgi:hypothetical protein
MGCRIDLRAYYEWRETPFSGGSGGVDRIDVVLSRSQVRIRLGWWARFPYRRAGSRSNEAVSVATPLPSDEFLETFKLRRGCNVKRRYRFIVQFKRQLTTGRTETRATRTIYYPSAAGWTRDTLIDLGNVVDHFILPTKP